MDPIRHHLSRFSGIYIVGVCLLVAFLLSPLLLEQRPTPLGESPRLPPPQAASATADAVTGAEPKHKEAPSVTAKDGRLRRSSTSVARVGGSSGECGKVSELISAYVPRCRVEWPEAVRSETVRGVTPKTIKLAYRITSDSPDLGMESEGWRISKKLISHFNQVFELYGRRVVIQAVHTRGRALDEFAYRGHQEACVDAARIAEAGFFGVLYQNNWVGTPAFPSQPFTDCSAKYELFLPLGAPYLQEQDYQRWHPYVWQIEPSCDRIAESLSHYVGRRLAERPAIHAGDESFRARQRVFGLYHPETPAHSACASGLEQSLLETYGIRLARRISYPLDVPLLAASAARSAEDFQKHEVTTLLGMMDQKSQELMTGSARGIDWYPEWVIAGADGQDAESAGRLNNQEEVDGHMFGQSSGFDRHRALSSSSEVAAMAKALNEELSARFTIYYLETLDLFNKLQAGGPNLSAHNIARGLAALPSFGSVKGIWGTWDYSVGHTALTNMREVYWHGEAIGADGRRGTFLSTNGGLWMKPLEWPHGEPAFPR